ncbi:MAG: hypothetical protein Q8Q37_00220, partial [bacterium]|nr:hypothetical protein [bacterium]
MIEDIIQERLKKRRAEHYPASVKRTYLIKDALADFSQLARLKKYTSLVGRIMGLRVQGNLIFCDVQDAT